MSDPQYDSRHDHGAARTVRTRRTPLLALALLSTLVLVGCRSNSHRMQFDPSPAELEIKPDASGPVRARGFVTVRGGWRRPDGTPELIVRVRLENVSDDPIWIEPDRLEVVSSDLDSFGVPDFEGRPVQVQPGETRRVDLAFPYPKGMPLSAPGLDGVSVRLGLAWDGGRVDVRVPFSRVYPSWYDPYPYPYYGYYGYYGWNWSVGYGRYCR